MKILQIDKYFFKRGGAGTVFPNTIQLLERHGYTVIPLGLKNKKNEPSPYESYLVDYSELSESSLPEEVKNLPAFICNKGATCKLEKLIQKEKPDVAHIYLMFNSMSASILPVLKKYNVPIIMSVHDYRLVCPAYTFMDGKRNFCERYRTGNYYNCMTRKCSKGNLINSSMLSTDSYFRPKFCSSIDYINRFIFVNKFSMDKHTQVENRFKDRCIYLYNFIPKVKDYSSAKGDYVSFFGRMSEGKGILTLLNVIKQVPNIKLKLAGTESLLEQLKPQCLPDAEFLGFKQGKKLRELIHNALFVVISSEYYENNPVTIIESYIIGTPAIGSSLEGVSEPTIGNRTGYTFKPKSSDDLKETIIRACSISEEEYAGMSDEAKEFAMDNFSEGGRHQKLIKNYQLIIDQSER